MNEIYSYLFIGIVVIGSLLAVVSALGILRLPDVYTRSHAASKTSTLAVSFVLIGTFLYFWVVKGHFNSRILLAIIFIFMTAPVAGHLISRAAYNTGVKLSNMTVRDDMKKARQASENKK
ncbi:monovalent cation/H(+) antiporter subunit G [Pradoshia sp.]